MGTTLPPRSLSPSGPLAFPDALAIVLREAAAVRATEIQTVPLTEAHGRVLAQTIAADRDQPPFDRSTRDGFALHLAPNPIPDPVPDPGPVLVPGPIPAPGAQQQTWHVIGQLFAGQSWSGPALRQGEALEIMTGAPVPPGAHAVVMIEHTVQLLDTQDPETLSLAPGRTITHGANIVPRASEATAGAALLAAGTPLGPAEIALAASVGAAAVEVFRRPRVAIVSTGDELVELGDSADPALAPHQIRNSNSYALAALVTEAGGIPWRLPIARDTRESLLATLIEARAHAGLLLLTGGVSMGKRDLVEEVLLSLGATFHFTGVRMQPGKPVVFGSLPAAHGAPPLPLFGLPGNPISAEVTFRCFANPVLRALAGERHPQPRFALARLAGQAPGNPNLTRLLPAHLTALDSGGLPDPIVRLIAWHGSGDLAANARANSYALLSPAHANPNAGDLVPVLLR